MPDSEDLKAMALTVIAYLNLLDEDVLRMLVDYSRGELALRYTAQYYANQQ